MSSTISINYDVICKILLDGYTLPLNVNFKGKMDNSGKPFLEYSSLSLNSFSQANTLKNF